MEEHGKRRVIVAALVVVGFVYFLVCAVPLRKELVLVPVWSRGLAGAAPGPVKGKIGTPILPYQLGDRFGYFGVDGETLSSAPVPYGVALARDAYAPYERLSEGFALRSPGGAELARCAVPGYPFFAAGRRFVVGPGQSSASEIGRDGNVLWSREFPSIAIAFDASADLAAFGLMDGSVVGIDSKGAEALRFSPGGSRISGIYGVAVSPDGQLVAAVSGLDRQRLVVLEKRASAYRVTYHRWLDSDFRRPVAMRFTADGRRLLYEAPDGTGVYDRASRAEYLIPGPGAVKLGLAIKERDLLVLLTGRSERKRLVIAAAPDRRVVDVPVAAQRAFVDLEGSSVFLGIDDDIVRLDLREE